MSNFIKRVLVLCVACAASIACKQNGDSTTNYADISVGDEMIAELTGLHLYQNLLEIVLLKN